MTPNCTASRSADSYHPVQGTVAEQVQLMLGLQQGRLEFEGTMVAAAVLIELVLLGRLSSVPNRGFFNGPAPRELVVADPQPTLNSILDSALRPMVARGKPWLPHGAMAKLGAAISLEVQEALEAAGIVRAVKQYPMRGAHLIIVDEEAHQKIRDRLAVARSQPDSVEDARTGAFIDVLRNGADSFTGEQGLHSYIRWEWYPDAVRDTIHAILQAERTQFGTP